MGDGQYESLSSATLLEKAREKYNVYHLHIKETGAGSRQETINGWKQLMGDNLILVENHRDVSKIIAKIIIGSESSKSSIRPTADYVKPIVPETIAGTSFLEDIL